MPAGDGVSLATTIAQAGTVAKTQAKTQTASKGNVPFASQLAHEDEARVERLEKSEETEQSKTNADGKNSDKRQRRRLKRKRKELGSGDDPSEAGDDANELDELGVLIDMRA